MKRRKLTTRIYCDFEGSERFCFDLCDVLDRHQCAIEIIKPGSETISDLGSSDFLLVEASLEESSMAHFRRLLTSQGDRPRVILITDQPAIDLSSIEKSLDADAVLYKTYDRYEIAFVFNRLTCSPGVNRRETPRVLAPIQVTCSHEETGETEVAQAFNIGLGGLFILSDSPKAAGTFLDLSIRLSETGPTIECTGRVAHQINPPKAKKQLSPIGMGIRFMGMTESDREQITRFIDRRLLRIDRKKYAPTLDLTPP